MESESFCTFAQSILNALLIKNFLISRCCIVFVSDGGCEFAHIDLFNI